MLEEILNNLKNPIKYEVYEVDGKVYYNSDLYKYICNIYWFLMKENVSKKPVIVIGHKDIYMIATFLACSFAGITYVPVDNSLPEERKEYIKSKIDSDIIIDNYIVNIMKHDNFEEIDRILLKPKDIYYIIFTSGSTGEPKGVKIMYENLESCINWLKKICDIKNTTILNQANFSFDLSVADIYLSLITKSKHYVIERKYQKDYNMLFEKVKNSDASFGVFTPSFMDLLLLDKSFNCENIKELRKILFCGESLKKSTIKKLKERFPKIEIINSYGPTECTFAVTSMLVNDWEEDEIPIGVFKKDSPVYIVDENLNIVSENSIGEILITGKSVGAGYLNQISNTSYINFRGERAYLTGDYGYFKNGILYCKGRKDNQIKYKGYRIELFEIEKKISDLPYIEKVIVTTSKNKEEKINKIIALVKIKENIEIEVVDIKEDLKLILPEYMIPIIKIVEEFEINLNGKCDTKNMIKEVK